MRKFVVLIVVSMLTQGLVFAATGHKAELTTTIELGDEMKEMMEAMASMGGPDAAIPADVLEPQIVKQTAYWTETAMRMETFSEGVLEDTSIVDYEHGVMYRYAPGETVATKMDLNEMAGANSEMFGPDPMDMFRDWETAVAAMEAQPHMTVNELSGKTINGLPCKGVSFVMDMAAMMNEQDDADAGMAMGMMGAMGGMSGEIWVNEALGFPVLVTMDAMGTMVEMTMSNLEDWTVDQSMLTVPADLTIEEFDVPDFSTMEMPEGH